MGRRRHEEEHDNHERWLVSYADFITLLFAFFVVMYAISSVNEGKYRVLSDSLVQAFRAVDNETALPISPPPRPGATPIAAIAPQVQVRPDPRLEARKAEMLQRMRNMADEVRRVLEPLVRGGQVRVTEGVNGISIEINASALFAPAEAQLGADASRALYAVAGVLAQGGFPIKVEGHTDSLPINTALFPSNWELSAVRASSVVRLFVAAGVNPGRLTAAGYADQRPVADNALAEGRARNKRVTILVESMLPEMELAATPSAQSATIPETPLRVRDADGALGTPSNIRLVPAGSQPQ
ncbi:MAG: flagellar motor protein MotD [Candidatus Dactylopiibacterium carminicum]|uniref:Flagellar motor protein MotD n=1 Tax=Candidatus Dactylopiibacterium carminicum TaxID=857335 RepID=A0A272EU08_9RHOO|nr:flagellar motor protein MotD [Candidatus Dactylopiibacterium carminicum]KAF7599640.1 flagellar motor protein MotD [Candidatus Dactylopiibacterium carminicum]PAS93582.1 MAG: flagellar motor protein MotD [Candidatus Dactylopiibacterium carminicum]PAS97425.1 MAG: flagellar motor protein MotD [Candidatus Dactylopiibacterium carminicum]PAS99641.1 MAG: flagellar motor protein MotD [Candidatus Dactylopiibacterium carminicum]